MRGAASHSDPTSFPRVFHDHRKPKIGSHNCARFDSNHYMCNYKCIWEWYGKVQVTNIYRNTNVKIAYKCCNTIANLTKQPTDLHTPPHNKWGIYQLTCNTCNLSYVGQTSRSLNIRFQEHIRYIRYNNPQSAYALHILQNQHEYGPINSTMTLLKPLNNPSLRAIIYPIPPPSRKTHSGTEPRWNQPSFPNGH